MASQTLADVIEAVRRHKWLIAGIAVVVAGAIVALTILVWRPHREEPAETSAREKPAAPPDLEKLRDRFVAGVDAVQRGDGREGVEKLGSFDFGSRAVEEYRLYYLANGHQVAGDPKSARIELARLLRRGPKFVYADDAGFNLAGLYGRLADWQHAASAFDRVAHSSSTPAIAANARWQQIESCMLAANLGCVYENAREIAVQHPKSPHAADAVAILRGTAALPETAPLPLTLDERLERTSSLIRDGEADDALAELDAIGSPAGGAERLQWQLNRGIALHLLRRFEDSNALLEPLTSSYYKFAFPALQYTAKNYRILSASINPEVTKTVTEKKKAGTVKVKVGKGKKARTVTKPRVVTVSRTVKLVDLAKKAKKETWERLATERLKDLLQLPIEQGLRLDVLNTLVGLAQAKKQDAYQQDLVRQIVKLDATADPALQYFWDKAWEAYTRGDFATAKPALEFIRSTYVNPNVKRQATYWYARVLERTGEKGNASKIYEELANAPYADVYAIHASNRGAKLRDEKSNPLDAKGPDWREIADREMPPELRLAYELAALTDMRDARLEIQRNMRASNQKYADALLAELYSSTGDLQLMYRSLKRAWPELATAEQDKVPPYFLKMYYPVKYDDAIRREAKKRDLDHHLVMALILQESYYNPKAKSRVGATGLMQLMPATGNEIARKLHGFFNVSRLENPETNIELGTYHLKSLVNMFGGNVYLAVASYNAGQGNVLKWKRAAPNKPLDEFLESIPFPETRNYVKRVTMLRAAYTRIDR